MTECLKCSLVLVRVGPLLLVHWLPEAGQVHALEGTGPQGRSQAGGSGPVHGRGSWVWRWTSPDGPAP